MVSCPICTKNLEWDLNIYYLHNCIGLPRTMYNQFCCIFTNTLFKAVFQKKSLAYNKLLSNGIFLIEKIALNVHKSGLVFLKIVLSLMGDFFSFRPYLLSLKVSKSQNKFMKSSFFPKNERNIARISALAFRAALLRS